MPAWINHTAKVLGLPEIDLDGHVDARGVRYIGKALRRRDGKYVCLADVGGALCRVECTIQIARKAG